jgi:hypothetical protein
VSSTSGGRGAGAGGGGRRDPHTVTSLSEDGQYVRVRRRSRRSSRRRTAYRYRLIAKRLLPFVAVFVVLAVPAGVIGADLVATQRALIGAEAELREARAALIAGDLVRASGAVRSADLLITPLVGRVDRPVWRAAAALPVVGEPLEMTRAIVDVASTGTALARLAVDDDLAILLESFDPRVADGRVELSPFIDAAMRLERLDATDLRASLDRLEATGASVTNTQLLGARRNLLQLGGEAVEVLERTRSVVATIPPMLGSDGVRRHLVLLQTSAELRGTGGLYGNATILEAENGRLTLTPVTDVGALLEAGSGAGLTPGPSGLQSAATTPEFAARYSRVGADRLFANVNLDPDLATSAQVTLDLYAARTGLRADGLVLLDPYGLQALLEALDVTLVLPPELIEGTSSPAQLPAARFARFTTVDVYGHFGAERAAERDELQRQLGDQALAAVFGRAWDGPRVARALLDAAAGRHVQVHSTRSDEQRALATTAIGGDLVGPLADPLLDVITVTHNNAVGGKQDVHLGHRLSVGIGLGVPDAAALRDALRAGPGSVLAVGRDVVIDAGITNTLTPGAFDLYVTGNCLVGGTTYGCFRGPEAFNRSWLTFWLDPATVVRQVTDQTGFPPVSRGTMHATSTYDVFMEVPPLEQRSVRLEADGPWSVTVDPDGTLTYRLLLWRQAKGVPDVLDVTVSAPEGYEIDAATMQGGRMVAPLAGPDEDVRPASLRVRRRSVSVFGASGTDLELTVRLRPVAP